MGRLILLDTIGPEGIQLTMAVLDGELAVPCTCNPLQQGRIPA